MLNKFNCLEINFKILKIRTLKNTKKSLESLHAKFLAISNTLLLFI